jgi:hypothetical protein
VDTVDNLLHTYRLGMSGTASPSTDQAFNELLSLARLGSKIQVKQEAFGKIVDLLGKHLDSYPRDTFVEEAYAIASGEL